MNYTKTLILASVAIAQLAKATDCTAATDYAETCADRILTETWENDTADTQSILDAMFASNPEYNYYTYETVEALECALRSEMATMIDVNAVSFTPVTADDFPDCQLWVEEEEPETPETCDAEKYEIIQDAKEEAAFDINFNMFLKSGDYEDCWQCEYDQNKIAFCAANL